MILFKKLGDCAVPCAATHQPLRLQWPGTKCGLAVNVNVNVNYVYICFLHHLIAKMLQKMTLHLLICRFSLKFSYFMK